jgi:transposase
VNTLKALLPGAPDDLRQAVRGLSTPRQASKCRSLRVRASQPVAEQILRTELRRLATQIGTWDRGLRANKAQLRQLVAQVMPALPGQPGVGPMSAAQLLVSWSHPGRCRSEAAFAALAGVSPLPASSGKITRHRLNPFGDRQLNRALHGIINWPMLHDPRTRAYLTRRTAHKTSPELRRCLNRYAARSLFRLMETATT